MKNTNIKKKTDWKKTEQYIPKKENEFLYYGNHLCETIAKCRIDDIIKVYITKNRSREYGDLLSFCARTKKVYKIVESKELEKITGTIHHEDIAIIASVKELGDMATLTVAIQNNPAPIIYLDGVSNPHNIGVILRLMAHYGFLHLVGGQDFTGLTASAARMSEGGSEYVSLHKASSIYDFVQWTKSNLYTMVGTSSHTKKSVYSYKFSPKTAIILGHEVNGISKEMLKVIEDILIIPGTGNVESLNVSTAASVMMNEYYRQITVV